jgi:hypothetical protein
MAAFPSAKSPDGRCSNEGTWKILSTAGTLFRAAADMIGARCAVMKKSGGTTSSPPKGGDGRFDLCVAMRNDRHDLE